MAAIVPTWIGVNNLNPNYKEEVIQCATIPNLDTYTSPNIGTITAVTMTPHLVGLSATAFYAATWVGNVITFTTGGTGAGIPYTVKIFGTA